MCSEGIHMVLMCIQFHCCGATNYSNWLYVDWYKGNQSTGGEPVIPLSCCATKGGCLNNTDIDFILEGDVDDGTYVVWTQV